MFKLAYTDFGVASKVKYDDQKLLPVGFQKIKK
jgi:hypothetical protein